MKKLMLFAFITVCWIILFFVFTYAYANNLPLAGFIQSTSEFIGQEKNEGSISSFDLPASLIIIEDEAFEGTAITTVNLPENVETIGEYAFANIQTLRKISIPNSTTYIGRNAFKGSTDVTITGAPKGYARAWALENGIPFNPINSLYAFSNTVQVNAEITNGRAERLVLEEEKAEESKIRLNGRVIGDLNAEKTETITAFHIQGRSPPMT